MLNLPAMAARSSPGPTTVSIQPAGRGQAPVGTRVGVSVGVTGTVGVSGRGAGVGLGRGVSGGSVDVGSSAMAASPADSSTPPAINAMTIAPPTIPPRNWRTVLTRRSVPRRRES